jgi:hypothetical protein
MSEAAKRDELVRFLAQFLEWCDGQDPITDMAAAQMDDVLRLINRMKLAAQFLTEWDTVVLQVQAAGGVPAEWGL